jgi:hypothetical protein
MSLDTTVRGRNAAGRASSRSLPESVARQPLNPPAGGRIVDPDLRPAAQDAASSETEQQAAHSVSSALFEPIPALCQPRTGAGN